MSLPPGMGVGSRGWFGHPTLVFWPGEVIREADAAAAGQVLVQDDAHLGVASEPRWIPAVRLLPSTPRPGMLLP